jgi:AraC family transcriptional regulator of arabinose operon
MRIVEAPGTIEVLEMAIDAIHARGFEMDPYNETPYFTFSYYNCPIVLSDSSGVREWPAGVSLVHAPDDRRLVRAESADLLNTWFHFDGSGVAACLSEYEIPINTVIDLGELPFLRSILEEVRQERVQQPLHWQDAVSDLIRRLFREFGALKSDLDNSLTPAQRTQERTLRDIRMRVHADLAHEWTVAEMASLGNWHPTWFATVYTRQFGVSPMNDLLNVRLRHAEALLIHLPMTVGHIASTCGFASVEHFNRLFRKRMGCTPSQIRKQGKR